MIAETATAFPSFVVACMSKSEGSTKFDKKQVEAVTNALFLRKDTEKISPYQRKLKKPGPKPPSSKHCESHLIGTIEEGPASAKVLWRIMGMRQKRCDGVTTDYDVYRMAGTREVQGVIIRERLPMDRREGILRMCRYDSPVDFKVFQHEYSMFKMLAKSFPNEDNRVHYPSILGEGRLAQMRFLGLGDSSSKKRETETLTIPRPYFILESIDPSLETLFKSNRAKSFPVFTSVFVAIGCMKALRLLHMKGFAHRNVQPAYFSIRLPCGGLLCRKESELCDLVAITELWCCKKFRANLIRRKGMPKYVGNWKYGSIETLGGKSPTAVDDLISCLYIMTEFALGELPWHKESEKQVIISKKKELEAMTRLEDANTQTLFSSYNGIYSWLRQQPFLKTIDYEALYQEILRLPDQGTAGAPGEQSLFGFSNPLIDSYEHGFVGKKGKKGGKGTSKILDSSSKDRKKKERKGEKELQSPAEKKEQSAEKTNTKRVSEILALSKTQTLMGLSKMKKPK